MKFKAKEKYCPKCGKKYDFLQEQCQHCQTLNEDHPFNENDKTFHTTPLKEGLFFIVGFLLFHILTSIIVIIVQLYAQLQFPTEEEQLLFLKSPSVLMSVNVAGFAIIFIALLILLWPYLKSLLKHFKYGKNWLYGLLGFILLTSFSMTYNYMLMGFGFTSNNANQTALNNIILSYPITSIIFFSIIGPIVEETTYRLGLFTILKRFNTVIAYVVTVIVFALIHFDFTAIINGKFLLELAYLPNYLFGGIILCYIYQKGSFAGSTIAHILNNLTGTLLMIISAAIIG